MMANAEGIHAWMASVRTSMTNDPCRQLFEDQVQTHAFVFLDDYLEHILAGPKQGPIIDLVKTPGRRKNVPRRTRAATAAATHVKSVSLFSLDSDSTTGDGVPVNSFHKALLQAKDRYVPDALGPQRFPTDSSAHDILAEKIHGRSKPIQTVDTSEISSPVEPELQAGFTSYPGDLPSEPTVPLMALERGTELSVIAEGEESPERTRANILLSVAPSKRDEFPQTLPPSRNQTEHCPPWTQADHESQENTSSDSQRSIPSSINTHHPVPLESRVVEYSQTIASNHTEPLPSRTGINSRGNRDVFTAPLPVVPVANPIPIPNTTSIPLNDTSPRTLAYKNGTASFPTLPAPSPLRKSMRITHEVITGSALPPAVPTLVPLGKRTSWLMKAREAKAMEGTGPLHGNPMTVVNAIPPRVSVAVKRKSDEMLDAAPFEPGLLEDHRKSKIAKSTEADVVSLIPKESHRDLPIVQGEPIPLSPIATVVQSGQLKTDTVDVDQQTHVNSGEEGFIDLFKRTVEGLGARAGKSMGKSLGGAAVAAALAEARAAAEAKVAERNKGDSGSDDSEGLRDGNLPNQELPMTRTQLGFPSTFTLSQPEATNHRLSLSELASEIVQSSEPRLSARTTRSSGVAPRTDSVRESISTTPPDSPPSKGTSSFVKPTGPVFNKPPPQPVFMPPVSKQPSIVSGPTEVHSNLPSGKYTLPAAVSLGIPARLASPSRGFPPRVQGTMQMPVQSLPQSIFSDPVSEEREGILSSMQDNQHNVDMLLRDVSCTTPVDDDDDDDSWPLEEKLAAAEPGWRPFDFSNVDKEDTWSSLPSESQGPTRNLTGEKNGNAATLPGTDAGTNSEDPEQEPDTAEVSDVDHSVMEISELEVATEAAMTSFGDVQPAARSNSQASIASTTQSIHPQPGFFSQATKLVNSMLGGGKKVKPELKSLQLAAAAAKRQQEEADKKTQRLKDMEARRQVAFAKKAEEERARLQEEEKRTRDELEKRKREREENTDRRPLRAPVSTKKSEDDTSKKRKLGPETEKKPEIKKPLSKDKKDLASSTKLAAIPGIKLASQKGAKAITTALVSSAAYNTTQNAPLAPSTKSAVPEAKPFKVVSSSLKGKAKAMPQEDDVGDKLPSTVVQSQMAARAKAQMQATKLPTPEAPSESIELPEINSEYSDSDAEDRPRTFDPPDWAHSPELRQALQMQSTMNPDNIFGAIRPLRMEEMFRTRHSRFRARTSSANWGGSDRLTVEEIREYERRMGFS